MGAARAANAATNGAWAELCIQVMRGVKRAKNVSAPRAPRTLQTVGRGRSYVWQLRV